MAALVPARRGTRSPRPGRGARGVGRGRDAAEIGTDARARLGGDLRRGTRRGNRGLCEGARRAAREVAQHRAARAAPRGGECADARGCEKARERLRMESFAAKRVPPGRVHRGDSLQSRGGTRGGLVDQRRRRPAGKSQSPPGTDESARGAQSPRVDRGLPLPRRIRPADAHRLAPPSAARASRRPPRATLGVTRASRRRRGSVPRRANARDRARWCSSPRRCWRAPRSAWGS